MLRQSHWLLPYLPNLPVKELNRCFFEFNNDLVYAHRNRYVGNRRYRFNQFIPITSRFPDVTQNGLILEVSGAKDQGLIGMATTQYCPVNGEVSFYVGDSIIKELDYTTDGFIDCGVGFLKFDEPWWYILDGCLLSCRRTMGISGGTNFYGFKSTPIPGFGTSAGLGKSFKFTAHRALDNVSISYTEFADNGTDVIASTYYNSPNITDDDLRVIFYTRAYKSKAEFYLVMTEFSNDWKFKNPERIYFEENPTDIIPPIGQLVQPPTNFYSQPNLAYIEDSVYNMSATTSPDQWTNAMVFLIDSTTEPMIFSDIEANPWLTCFQSLECKGRKGNNRHRTIGGYDLNLAVLVVH